MSKIDLHQHVWPDGLVDALRKRRRPPCLEGAVLALDEGSFEVDVDAYRPEPRLDDRERDGFDAIVASLQPTLAERLPPGLVDAYHEGILDAAAASSGAIRPLAAGRVAEGFVGACVGARALLDLDGLAPLLDGLSDARQFLFVHPGPGSAPAGAPPWWAPGVDYVAQMQAAYGAWIAGGADRWPNVPVVFAILAGGAPFQLERLAGRGLDVRSMISANVYLETSSYGRRALELTMATYGVSRIVYGSDAPVSDPRTMLREVKTFGKAVTAAVCEENPARLLS